MIRSSQTFPTSSTYYHLALSFARSGELQDLQQAIANAGLAVEGDSKEVRYWHLLGLLTAATEQWEAAEIALETGATIGEEEVSVVNGSCPPEATQKDPDNELLGVPSPTVNGNGRVIDGLPRTDDDRHPVLNGTEEVPEVQPVYLLGKDDHDIPPASNLLQPAQDHPSPSRQELFEDSLQLRMTQVALTEVVEGAEGASQMLPEIFVWTADRVGHSVTDTGEGVFDFQTSLVVFLFISVSEELFGWWEIDDAAQVAVRVNPFTSCNQPRSARTKRRRKAATLDSAFWVDGAACPTHTYHYISGNARWTISGPRICAIHGFA